MLRKDANGPLGSLECSGPAGSAGCSAIVKSSQVAHQLEQASVVTQFAPSDFDAITLGDIASQQIGFFWVAHVEHEGNICTPTLGGRPLPGTACSAACGAGSSSLHSLRDVTSDMMDREHGRIKTCSVSEA